MHSGHASDPPDGGIGVAIHRPILPAGEGGRFRRHAEPHPRHSLAHPTRPRRGAAHAELETSSRFGHPAPSRDALRSTACCAPTGSRPRTSRRIRLVGRDRPRIQIQYNQTDQPRPQHPRRAPSGSATITNTSSATNPTSTASANTSATTPPNGPKTPTTRRTSIARTRDPTATRRGAAHAEFETSSGFGNHVLSRDAPW